MPDVLEGLCSPKPYLQWYWGQESLNMGYWASQATPAGSSCLPKVHTVDVSEHQLFLRPGIHLGVGHRLHWMSWQYGLPTWGCRVGATL